MSTSSPSPSPMLSPRSSSSSLSQNSSSYLEAERRSYSLWLNSNFISSSSFLDLSPEDRMKLFIQENDPSTHLNSNNLLQKLKNGVLLSQLIYLFEKENHQKLNNNNNNNSLNIPHDKKQDLLHLWNSNSNYFESIGNFTRLKEFLKKYHNLNIVHSSQSLIDCNENALLGLIFQIVHFYGSLKFQFRRDQGGVPILSPHKKSNFQNDLYGNNNYNNDDTKDGKDNQRMSLGVTSPSSGRSSTTTPPPPSRPPPKSPVGSQVNITTGVASSGSIIGSGSITSLSPMMGRSSSSATSPSSSVIFQSSMASPTSRGSGAITRLSSPSISSSNTGLSPSVAPILSPLDSVIQYVYQILNSSNPPLLSDKIVLNKESFRDPDLYLKLYSLLPMENGEISPQSHYELLKQKFPITPGNTNNSEVLQSILNYGENKYHIANILDPAGLTDNSKHMNLNNLFTYLSLFDNKLSEAENKSKKSNIYSPQQSPPTSQPTSRTHSRNPSQEKEKDFQVEKLQMIGTLVGARPGPANGLQDQLKMGNNYNNSNNTGNITNNTTSVSSSESSYHRRGSMESGEGALDLHERDYIKRDKLYSYNIYNFHCPNGHLVYNNDQKSNDAQIKKIIPSSDIVPGKTIYCDLCGEFYRFYVCSNNNCKSIGYITGNNKKQQLQNKIQPFECNSCHEKQILVNCFKCGKDLVWKGKDFGMESRINCYNCNSSIGFTQCGYDSCYQASSLSLYSDELYSFLSRSRCVVCLRGQQILICPSSACKSPYLYFMKDSVPSGSLVLCPSCNITFRCVLCNVCGIVNRYVGKTRQGTPIQCGNKKCEKKQLFTICSFSNCRSTNYWTVQNVNSKDAQNDEDSNIDDFNCSKCKLDQKTTLIKQEKPMIPDKVLGYYSTLYYPITLKGKELPKDNKDAIIQSDYYGEIIINLSKISDYPSRYFPRVENPVTSMNCLVCNVEMKLSTGFQEGLAYRCPSPTCKKVFKFYNCTKCNQKSYYGFPFLLNCCTKTCSNCKNEEFVINCPSCSKMLRSASNSNKDHNGILFPCTSCNIRFRYFTCPSSSCFGKSYEIIPAGVSASSVGKIDCQSCYRTFSYFICPNANCKEPCRITISTSYLYGNSTRCPSCSYDYIVLPCVNSLCRCEIVLSKQKIKNPGDLFSCNKCKTVQYYSLCYYDNCIGLNQWKYNLTSPNSNIDGLNVMPITPYSCFYCFRMNQIIYCGSCKEPNYFVHKEQKVGSTIKCANAKCSKEIVIKQK